MASINIKKELVLDGGGSLILSLNEKTGKLFTDFSDALLSSRDITSNINAAHRDVILLAAYAKENGLADESPAATEELVDGLITIVRNEHERFERETRGQAFILALLNSNFKSKSIEFTNEEIEVKIPDNFWDRKQDNSRRIENLLPPLPSLNRFHPLERKLAVIETLTNDNPQFGNEIQLLASQLFSKILAGALDSVDDNNFQS
jgi:hypothetical protein